MTFRASISSSRALALFFSSVAACGEAFACCAVFLVFVWDLVALRLSGGELPVAPVVSVPLGDIPLF